MWYGYFFIGVCLMGVGYLIWVKKKYYLLAGYYSNSPDNREKMGRIIGIWMCSIGALVALYPIAFYLIGNGAMAIYFGLSIIGIISLFVVLFWGQLNMLLQALKNKQH